MQAQDVAEAARQERAKKETKPKRAKHVYTNEDLARAHILAPEDIERAEAQRKECAQQKENCPLEASQNPPANLKADSAAPEISLGEVARKYRKEKELQAQKELLGKKELQALKPKQTSPFHLPTQTPALASPVLPERPVVRVPRRSPQSPPVVKRDPFRRILVPPVAPASPMVRARRTTPQSAIATSEQHESVKPTEPVRPEVSAPPVLSVSPVQPARPVQPERKVVPSIVANQKSVSVQRGDSLWKLAKENLGQGSRWNELLAVNPWITNPNKIRIGSEVTLPTASSSADSSVKIKVHKGDTLWKLAKTNLGRSAYWPCLAHANAGIHNPDLIYENQELLLPTSCKP